jgi:hypothetical protein
MLYQYIISPLIACSLNRLLASTYYGSSSQLAVVDERYSYARSELIARDQPHCIAFEYLVWRTWLSCGRDWVSVFIQINSCLTKLSSTWFAARDCMPSVTFLCISARMSEQYQEAGFGSILASSLKPLTVSVSSIQLTLLPDSRFTIIKKNKTKKKNKQTPWPLVRERTIPTERPPFVDEI